MSTSTCHTSLDICALRVAQLTTAGAPKTGATNGYVTNMPQTLDVTVNTLKGSSDSQLNGCGVLSYFFQAPDSIQNLALGITLLETDAELMRILTGGGTFVSAGADMGATAPAVGTNPPAVCVEAWTKAWGTDTQYAPPFTSPTAAYMHWVFPYTTWVVGKFTLEHKILITPLTGLGSENPFITVNGPFDDWPAPVVAGGGIKRLYGWYYDTNLPTQTCAPIAVTSAAS
jgi:hypothetical protein